MLLCDPDRPYGRCSVGVHCGLLGCWVVTGQRRWTLVSGGG